MRTDEGARQKGLGLREEGHGAGSQGVWPQQPPVPVQTHPGSARTHRRPQIHAYGPTGSETHADTRAHARARTETLTYNSRRPHEHAGPHAAPRPPTPRFWSPCILSEYCQRLGQRGGQSRLPRNGPSPLCLPTRVKPQGSGLGAEELGFCEGGPEARPLGARGGWCGSQVGAGPLHFDLSSSPRSQDLGRQQRGAGWGRGEEQDNSRRTSSVQYGRLSHYYYNIL